MASTTSSQITPPNGEKAESEESSLWALKAIPGKDFGLVAKQDIKAGTLVISEAPIITTAVITSTDMEITESDLTNALQKLSLADQTAFKYLHNNFRDAYPLAGIVRSNAYPLGATADVGGVFLTISRLNHSCWPNTVQYYNPLIEQQTIHAIRDIPAGEEITTSYHAGGTSKQRKNILRTNFGFTCSCQLCSLPDGEMAESDARFTRAAELDDKVGDSKFAYYHPDQVLIAGKELLDIFKKEKITDGRISRLYYDCFQTCNLHGDLARARCFAKYYVDMKKLAEGEESLNVLDMKRFVKKPEEHGSYEKQGKWKTAKTGVPKGLNSRDFAKWLWREDA